MSILAKKPYIDTLIESMSDEQITTLGEKINSATIDRNSIVSNLIDADKGVHSVIMKFSDSLFLKGILIYTLTECGFIAFDNTIAGSDILPFFKIDASTGKYTPINEKLTADELRGAIDDIQEKGKVETDDIEAKKVTVKGPLSVFSGDERIVDVNATNKTTSIYRHLKVGSAETPSDLVVNGDAEINGTLTATNILQGSNWLVKGMAAPESTTLTDEEIAQIIDGRFINGNFLSMTNPVLLPAKLVGGIYYGLIIAKRNANNGDSTIGTYQINESTKVITASFGLTFGYNGKVAFFNGVEIPSFPASTGTFVLKCIDGTLTWVQE